MKNNTIGLINLDFLLIHDDESFFRINTEEGHGVGLMIEADQVLIIREKRYVLRIISAHGKAEKLAQLSGILINLEHYSTVVSCIGGQKVFVIIRKRQGRSSRARSVIVIECAYLLDSLKFRSAVFVRIIIDIYGITKLMDDIHESAGLRELNVSRCGFLV